MAKHFHYISLISTNYLLNFQELFYQFFSEIFLGFCNFVWGSRNFSFPFTFSLALCTSAVNFHGRCSFAFWPTRSRSSEEKLGPLAKNPERTGWGIDFGSLASGWPGFGSQSGAFGQWRPRRRKVSASSTK